MYRSGSDTGFYDKCSAVRALRVYLQPRFSLHRTENDNITLRPLKCRYHSDMEFLVCSIRNSNFRRLGTRPFISLLRVSKNYNPRSRLRAITLVFHKISRHGVGVLLLCLTRTFL